MFGNTIQGPIAAPNLYGNPLFYVGSDQKLHWVIATNGDNPVNCAANTTNYGEYRDEHLGGNNDSTVRKQLVQVSRDSSISVSVYPNPSENTFTFMMNLPKEVTDVVIQISNMQGNAIYTTKGTVPAGSNQYGLTWDATNVSNGIYIYSIKISNGQTFNGKLVKL